MCKQNNISISQQVLLEIGTNRLQGLQQVDLIFKQLKACKDKLDIAKLNKKLEIYLSKLLSCKVEIYTDYLGSGAFNFCVIPIYKFGKINKNKKKIELGNIERLHLVYGKELLDELNPREITAILLHEIGHIVNHLTGGLKVLNEISELSTKFITLLSKIPIIGQSVFGILFLVGRSLYFTQHMSEYNADKLAVEYGYGDELIHAFKIFKNKEIESHGKFLRTLYIIRDFIYGSTHPNSERRIKKIITMIKNEYANEYKNSRIKEILDKTYS